ncbi:MAG: radical SAM protein [Phycisphaerae bacterium]|nr:radical SAM protein [Phycisphaerae bacterium]
MKQTNIKPKIIAFEVTRRCRLHCPHCRAKAGIDPKEEVLTTNQCKEIIRSIADYKKCVLILTGGEPLERQDIYELIDTARDNHLKVAMATCGYLINEDSIKKLKKAGVLTLSFSLDGDSAETHDEFRQTKGAFDIVIKAAALARKANIRFQINMAISKLNIDEVFGVYELSKKIGAYCFNPFILVPTGRGEMLKEAILDPIEYQTLLNEFIEMKLENTIKIRITCGPQFAPVSKLQKNLLGINDEAKGCLGGREFGFISYKGDIQICGFLDISAGNLIKNNYNFEKIWTESEFLNKIRSRNFTGACGNCGYITVCGGCRARAYTIAGDYMATDPICAYLGGDEP